MAQADQGSRLEQNKAVVRRFIDGVPGGDGVRRIVSHAPEFDQIGMLCQLGW